MKQFFFYPPYFLPGFFVLSVMLLIKLPLVLKLVYLFVLAILGFLFRRSQIPYQDTVKSDGEILLSPIHGEVKSIHRHAFTTEIRIAMSFFDPKGLYMPITAEVSFLKANKGRKISRNSDETSFYGSLDDVSLTDLSLTSKKSHTIQLRFVDSTAAVRPTIWLKSGDRGRAGACFGYYPFGGTLLVYLPADCDVLVFEKEHVVPGLSVIAAIKG